MGTTDNATAGTAAKVSSNTGTGFGNNPGGEFATGSAPTPPSAAPSGLSGSVGIGGANAPDDVFQVSSALASNGLMDGPQDTADSTLFSGIISAQEQMDSALKRDGLVKPDGPTQQTFARLNDQGFVKAPAPVAPPRPALPRDERPVTAKTIPVMPVDEANSADNAKLLERQNAKTRKLAKRDAAVARINQENQEKQDRLLARQAVKQQRDQAEQQAKKQRQAINNVKKLTKAVYEQLNPGDVVASSNALSPRHAQADGNPADQSKSLDPGLRRHDGMGLRKPPLPMGEGRGEGSRNEKNLPQIPDETIQSNQRLATALAKRTGAGDLPKFTADAINTDSEKAIPEVADLIEQVRENDPEQAQELFDKTMQDIGNGERRSLNAAFPEFDQRHELSASNTHGKIDNHTSDTPQSARDNLMDNDIWSIPDEPMADGGADHVQPGDAEGPKDHADQIEGHGVGADEQNLKIKSAVDALSEIEAASSANKRLDNDQLESLYDRMDRGFAFDTDAREKADKMVDALQRGDRNEAEKLQAELNTLAHDPVRQRAQQESAAYYRRTSKTDLEQNASERGKHRMAYEDAFVGLAVNAAHLEGAEFKVSTLKKAASKGDPTAVAALPAAQARVDGIRQRIKDGSQKIRDAAQEYGRIPRPPHPDIDREGAAKEENAETRVRRKQDTLAQVASGALAIAGGTKSKAIGALAAAPAAANAFSQALRDETIAAARKDGVDVTDREALTDWAEKNPDAGHGAIERAAQFGMANFFGAIGGDAVGGKIGGRVGDLFGFGMDEMIKGAITPPEFCCDTRRKDEYKAILAPFVSHEKTLRL